MLHDLEMKAWLFHLLLTCLKQLETDTILSKYLPLLASSLFFNQNEVVVFFFFQPVNVLRINYKSH